MPTEGLLLIDKPPGPTSHDVVAQLRRVSGIRRVGHAGTLDPLASGLLLVCLGRATRLLEYLLDQPKRYEAAVRLGQRTDTFDAQGVMLEEKLVEVDRQALEAALEPFRGTIRQLAPAYSAVKRDGIPLYKLAREGQEVERPAREVTIDELRLLAWEKPIAHLAVRCSSGTYIRSLADDLGQALGCGGHISALRRTSVGAFNVADARALDTLDRDNWHDCLLPPEVAVGHLPCVCFTPQLAERLLQGQRVAASGSGPDGRPARAFESSGRFLGIVVGREKQWQPHKMFPPL